MLEIPLDNMERRIKILQLIDEIDQILSGRDPSVISLEDLTLEKQELLKELEYLRASVETPIEFNV